MLRIISSNLFLMFFLFISLSQNSNAEELKTSSPIKKEAAVGFVLEGKIIKKAGYFYIRTKSEDARFPDENKTDYSIYQGKEVVLTGKGFVTSGAVKSRTVVGNKNVPYNHRITSVDSVVIKVEPEKPKKEKKVEEKPAEEKPKEEKPAEEKPAEDKNNKFLIEKG